VFKDKEPRKAKNVAEWEKNKMIETVNGGDSLIDSKNTNPNKMSIHIHGGMEHNLVGYAKYYSYGHTKILGNRKFTREIDHNRRDFYGHW
jgi:hypothetical protein